MELASGENHDDYGAYQDIPTLDSRHPLEIPAFEEKEVTLPSLDELDRMTELKQKAMNAEIAHQNNLPKEKENDNDIEAMTLEVTKVLSKRK
jgi:hypothetical protein